MYIRVGSELLYMCYPVLHYPETVLQGAEKHSQIDTGIQAIVRERVSVYGGLATMHAVPSLCYVV